ncbi:anthocyanidin 3-O-galactosyltransferase F3GT1-like [Cornus florida]|uniref:anthocyanidin 3-O-galactosyltransferase F3GT1-like n=1 Tax=Cornus florida TaxID=4283 RepID=UPI00289CCBA8|nr:anthocyanidin 3-O-galactosyltransferase F3GT1-like [Cornus florida]
MYINVGTDVAGLEDEIVTFLPGFPSLRLGDLPNGVVMGNLEAPFSILLYKMAHALPRATAVIINSFEEVDLLHTNDLKSKFQKFLSVGPFNFTSPLPWSNRDEHGCLAWLDKHKAASVAYIGFGTRATPTPKEVGALAEALEASGTPFLWSLGDNMTRHLPKGFLGRTSTGIGKIVAWAPQVQVFILFHFYLYSKYSTDTLLLMFGLEPLPSTSVGTCCYWSFCVALWMHLGVGKHCRWCANDLEASLCRAAIEYMDGRKLVANWSEG